MASRTPATAEQRESKFYLPGTPRAATQPGRLERVLRGFSPEIAESRTVETAVPDYGFYLPGTVASADDAGPIERFVTKPFRSRSRGSPFGRRSGK